MSILEEQVVMGTFTHRTEYLPSLQASINKHLPGVLYTHVVRKGPINQNMEALRQAFIASGKRFWLFLDDDIQFLNGRIVHDAVETLIRNKWAGVTTYSTFRPEALWQPYATEQLSTREVGWMVGYFALVDSKRVGHIRPDLDLPFPNTSVDTSYSVSIRAEGHALGIIPHYVYHHLKPGTWVKQEEIDPTNDYLRRKWGDFYFDNTDYQKVVIEWMKIT